MALAVALVAEAGALFWWAVGLLGEIGPPARKALPLLEQDFDPLNPAPNVARAIYEIDPDEATRLGLPGLLIICPDRY